MKERCVKERGGSGGGGTAVCVAEVHNWHALESCGLALGGRSLELKQVLPHQVLADARS